MPLPQFSICIPTRNRPSGLEKLLNSVFEQTYSEYEIVILDNSDDNNTFELVKINYSGHPKLFYYRNETVLNMGANWNKCISYANKDWIKMMHDDDCFSSSKTLEIMAEAIQKRDLQAITFAYQNVHQDGRSEKVVLSTLSFWLKNSFPFYVYKNNFIGNPCCLVYGRNINIHYNDGLKWLVDVQFYLQLKLSGIRIEYCNKPIIDIGISALQATNQYKHNISVELKEHQMIAVQFQHQGYYQSYFSFDTIWRLVRNIGIEQATLNEYIQDEKFKNYLEWIIGKQSGYSTKILRNSIISLILKVGYYITYRIGI